MADPKKLAEYVITLRSGGVFYASWPRDADPQELRAAGAMVAPLTAWWADKLASQAAGEQEYASWAVAAGVNVEGRTNG